MEPLRPDLREALKEAHPGLTDDVIDEYENLTALRYKLDAGAFEESLAEIDRKRELLLDQDAAIRAGRATCFRTPENTNASVGNKIQAGRRYTERARKTPMTVSSTGRHADIREGVRDLCAQFPDAYWHEVDRDAPIPRRSSTR